MDSKFLIRQEAWNESPCSACCGTPCCRNMPLDSFRMSGPADFINLAVLSCYSGFNIGLKSSGEWTVFLSRKCGNLDGDSGKCLIHAAEEQSLICKSYSAQKCWYTGAFNSGVYTVMVPFDFERLIWLEKRYNLAEKRFNLDAVDMDWDELCTESSSAVYNTGCARTSYLEGIRFLEYSGNISAEVLFFSPYQPPRTADHLELASFRLGFPGVTLAVNEYGWSYAVEAKLDYAKLELFRRLYYPGVSEKDFCYSPERRASSCGIKPWHKWLIVDGRNYKWFRSLFRLRSDGRITGLPDIRELFDDFFPEQPAV